MARADLKAIKRQASFCADLMDRLVVDLDEDDEPHFSRYREDIKRIRRELTDLSHKMEWDWQ